MPAPGMAFRTFGVGGELDSTIRRDSFGRGAGGSIVIYRCGVKLVYWSEVSLLILRKAVRDTEKHF